jgi:hypothetical protein
MSGDRAIIPVLFFSPTVVVLTKEVSGMSPTWGWAKFLSAEVLARTQLVLEKVFPQIFGYVIHVGTTAIATMALLETTSVCKGAMEQQV